MAMAENPALPDQPSASLQTRAELEVTKLAKFRALVRHANTHSPYYARLISERRLDPGTCTPADFPVLTKAILMANFDDIVTDRRITKKVVADFLSRSSDPTERLFGEVTVMHTSGTSGEVGYFLYAPSDQARMNAGSRRFRQVFKGRFPKKRRRRFRRVRIAFYGATGGHFAGVTAVSALQRGLRRLFLKTAAFEVNTPLPGVTAGLDRFEPDVLIGYTTALKVLAEEQRAGRLHVAPIAVAATGEMVTKADLKLLSEAFGDTTALSVYACTEHMLLGISNPDGDTMTLTDENLSFEFHDDHSIVTNLANFTMPLIRYRMSDILQPVSEPDARLIIVKGLVGRVEKLPTFVNGAGSSDFLSPHTINEIFVPGVTRFQMQITGPASFRFPFCVDGSLDGQGRATAAAGIRERLQQILKQKGLENVAFETQIVPEIPLNERTRKFQLIIDTRQS